MPPPQFSVSSNMTGKFILDKFRISFCHHQTRSCIQLTSQALFTRRHFARKVEQTSEKSSCKLGIFLCHIVRPLTQPNCLDIEHGLFSLVSGTLQGHFSCMLIAFAYIFVDLLEGKGESPRVFCITRKVIHQLFYLLDLDIAC